MAAREIHCMTHVGDQQGEHLDMERGQKSAWPHVVAGAVIFGLTSLFVFSGIFEAVVSATFSSFNLGFITSVLSLAFDFGWVWWVYLDRWRVNEAYTSRYVSGPGSLAYVPLISIGYALSRCVERLQTSFSKPPP